MVLKDLPNCDLRIGCEAISRTEDAESTVLEYIQDGLTKSIRTSWLVGADGKRGVVRKKFLEPEGITQVEAVWPYVGTWVAANLQIVTPTEKTHPDFPLWQLGYTPEQVHDIFWPSGFHFCNNPKRPAVSGRFGPAGAKFWRYGNSLTSVLAWILS
jgi:2-polyprenyl-6-methoxyphenol hydroxylase-like FAD-dependent oxidoreductase